MNWKRGGYWSLVFVGLCFFFLSFGTSTFQRQEEVQMFIPEWGNIWNMLSVPGGFCTVAGQAVVQYYTSSWFVLLANALFLCGVGYLCHLLLKEVVPHGYNGLLALFPVLGLLKAHTSPFYVVDGTVGILLFLLALLQFVRIRRMSVRAFYGGVSLFLLYVLAGQLVALYGLAVFFLTLLCRKSAWRVAFAVCLIGLLLTGISIRCAIGVPLTDGIYSEHYQEAQLQPDSYLYYVWIRFVALLLILSAIAFLLNTVSCGKRVFGVAVTASLCVLLFFFSAFCLPGAYEVRNSRMNELSLLAQRNDWYTIIHAHPEKKPTDYVSLNYLNLALAQSGALGDQMFHYDQKGPQSLLTAWDRTYYMSCLLSDIHYAIGDISLSEGYAMEGLTLAKRGGSPRMLQRLFKISLIRRDLALADKYLHLLARLPKYRRWVEKYAAYVSHPERIGQDKELAGKTLPDVCSDSLLCLIDMDNLWMEHLSEPAANRIAWEYLGCSYLLAKEMEKFNAFLSCSGRFLPGGTLPVHFQEAALVLAVEDRSVLEKVSVRPEIVQRYKQFQKDIRAIKESSEGLPRLYQQYGDTFWFYYYCKKLNG